MGERMLDGGLFSPPAIDRLLGEHEAGRFDHSQALWLLLVFEGFLFANPGQAVAVAEETSVG